MIDAVRNADTEMPTTVAREDAITLSSVLEVSAIKRRNMVFHFMWVYTDLQWF